MIEHVEDPFAFLDSLERLARVVIVNFLEPSPDEPDVHQHELPIPELLDHAAHRRLRRYRRYHDRSHLVVYESRPGNALAGRARLAAGKIRSR